MLPVLSVFVCLLASSVHGSAIPSIPRFRLFGDERIVGGSPIKITEAPFQVSYQYVGSHLCGGSIISPNYVLTAAHCVRNVLSVDKLKIGSGSENKTAMELRAAVRNVLHPKYNFEMFDYDVGVAKVATPFVESAVRKSIALLNVGEKVADGELVVVTGWGNTQDASDRNLLRAVEVAIVNQDVCNKQYATISNITSRMVCAGVPAGGKDSCQGDSGGPLVVKKTGKQVGVVSWGYGCALKNYPGVYANVAHKEIRDFIDSELKQPVIFDSSNDKTVDV